MFQGRRAWFSQSVSPGPRELWVADGGTLAHWRDAEFLFSSDATHPDTQRIHKSHNYVQGRATVFHSQYLSAWASSGAGMKTSVALGNFILPPACLQEAEIRRKIGWFIWEQVDNSLAEQRDIPGVSTHLSVGCTGGNFPLAQVDTQPPQYTFVEPPVAQPNGNLLDGVVAVGRAREEEVEENALDLAESSEEETGTRAPSQQEFPHRALQEYPVNNMMTDYPSARDMKKYTGEIHYFIPGTSGYEVHWIQDDIDLYSDRKTKAKRKL